MKVQIVFKNPVKNSIIVGVDVERDEYNKLVKDYDKYQKNQFPTFGVYTYYFNYNNRRTITNTLILNFRDIAAIHSLIA
jgi:hypothetical protein